MTVSGPKPEEPKLRTSRTRARTAARVIAPANRTSRPRTRMPRSLRIITSPHAISILSIPGAIPSIVRRLHIRSILSIVSIPSSPSSSRLTVSILRAARTSSTRRQEPRILWTISILSTL